LSIHPPSHPSLQFLSFPFPSRARSD
jgi:hypothetical protein